MDEKTLREQIAALSRQLVEVCERKGGAEYAHCVGCDQVKPLSDFHKTKKGLARCYCRECWHRNCHEYRQRDGYTQKLKQYQQKRYTDPEHRRRLQARNRLTQKIRSGKFPKAATLRCSVCGGPASQFHHLNGYDPDRWDDVVPVCKDCHGELHTINK